MVEHNEDELHEAMLVNAAVYRAVREVSPGTPTALVAGLLMALDELSADYPMLNEGMYKAIAERLGEPEQGNG